MYLNHTLALAVVGDEPVALSGGVPCVLDGASVERVSHSL